MLGLEIRHTNGTRQALRLEVLQGVPRLDVRIAVLDRGWPMDEVEVDVVEAQLGQTGLDGLASIVGMMGAIPQLGGDEKVLAIRPESASARPHPPRCRRWLRCRYGGNLPPGRR